MKILHLLNHTQNIGNGIVNAAVDLACLQSQWGHRVVVAAGQKKLCERSNVKEYKSLLIKHGIEYEVLEQERTPKRLWYAARRYRKIVQSLNPDIVHVHMMTGLVLAKILRLHSRYRLISTVHNEFQRSAMLMGLADSVIAVSQAVSVAMQQRGIPERKLQTILNATIGSPRQQPMSS